MQSVTFVHVHGYTVVHVVKWNSFSVYYNLSFMPRSHFHEYLCEWPCDHEINQYSTGMRFARIFNLFPVVISLMRMPCECHESSMRIVVGNTSLRHDFHAILLNSIRRC